MLNLFYIKDIDSHYIIKLLGLRIRLKHKCRYKYKKAQCYGITSEKRDPELIVSLTSYPDRIKTVEKTINTILQQSVKPDKIILWLAKEQFKNGRNDLPKTLLDLEKLGLTIDWCEDLRSYKKLIPTLKKYPNSIIVTADDDIYYEKDWLESLYNAYLKNPNNIYVRRAIRVKLTKDRIIRLSDRQINYRNYFEPSMLNQLVGCGGCLYPPQSLYKDILDENKFMSLIPTHDDVYFWFMTILNNKKVQIIKGFDANVYCIEGTQEFGLCKKNNDKNGEGMTNQQAYDLMLKEYPEVIDILKKQEL